MKKHTVKKILAFIGITSLNMFVAAYASVLTVDEVNQRVGIGTETPTTKLEVAGDVLIDANYKLYFPRGADQSKTAYIYNSITGSSGSNLQIRGDGVSTGIITLRPGSSGKVVVSQGNFGVGTSNPSQKLHIFNGNLLIDNNTSGNTNSGLRLIAPISSTQYNWMIGAQKNVDAGLEITPSTSAGGTTFSNPTAVFTAGGNVGIGTTNPASKLHVRGASGTAANIQVETLNRATDATLTLKTDSGSWAIGAGTAVGGDNLVFYEADGGNSHIVVQNGGNVGIGTTNPASKLEVAGTVHSTNGGFKFPDGTVQTTAAAAANNCKWADVTDPQFGAIPNDGQDDAPAIQEAINSLQSGGMVYIPFGEYTINSTISITHGSYQIIGNGATLRCATGLTNGAINIRTRVYIDNLRLTSNRDVPEDLPNGTNTLKDLPQDGSIGIYINNVQRGQLNRVSVIDFGTGIKTDGWDVADGGIVNCELHHNTIGVDVGKRGVGTWDNNKLQIKDSLIHWNGTGIKITGGHANTISGNQISTNHIGVQVGVENTATMPTVTGNHFEQNFIVDVHIGGGNGVSGGYFCNNNHTVYPSNPDNPQAPWSEFPEFPVDSSNFPMGYYIQNAEDPSGALPFIGNNTFNGAGATADYKPYVWNVMPYGKVGLMLDKTGNIGIGVTTPDAKLTVGGTNSSAIKINNGGDLVITKEVSGDDTILYNDFGRLNISTGIDVNGPIYQRGSVLYADYVFATNYRLESIEEHSRYMWKNKHLKAMPKAKTDELGNEMIELGAHNKGIVEELEKAHIYIQQLNERIKLLESKINVLEN